MATIESTASVLSAMASFLELDEQTESARDTLFAFTGSGDDAALDTVFDDLDQASEQELLAVIR